MLHSNDYPVLAKIFNNSSNKIFILRAKGAIDIPDQLGCSILFFKTKTALLKVINYEKEGTVINETALQFEEDFSQKYPSIVLLSLRRSSPNSKAKEFNTILNPDGTIRWIYSKQLEKPIFLNLYNTSSWKGKLFKWACKFYFKFQIQSILNTANIWVNTQQLNLDNISDQLNTAPYAIFTGTTGENRKAIICYEQQGQVTQFLKMPLTKPAQILVNNESQQLQKLQQQNFLYLQHPNTQKINNSLLLSDVRPTKKLSNKNLTKIHFSALKELYQYTATTQLISSLPIWKSVLNDLSIIRNSSVKNNISILQIHHLACLLETLLDRIDPNQIISSALAHGDFTPWNTYLSSSRLHVYDWELAQQLPMLYDCFHYLFQTNILVNRKSFQEIKKAINHLEQEVEIQSILQDYQIDFQLAYQLYLLHNISYYLSRYMRQEYLHEQAHWLLDTWTEALEFLLETSDTFVLHKT